MQSEKYPEIKLERNLNEVEMGSIEDHPTQKFPPLKNTTTILQKHREENRNELILSYVFMLLEMFKIVMSCLLVVFVAQNCGNDINCTFEENFVELIDLNKAALGWNFITLGFFLMCYYTASRRERILIDYFDTDLNLPINNIAKVVLRYPRAGSTLTMFNTRLFWFSISLIIVFIVNLALSAAVIFGNYYLGYQSVFQFISQVLLSTSVVYRFLFVSQKDEALSAFIDDPRFYNEIDKTYVERV